MADVVVTLAHARDRAGLLFDLGGYAVGETDRAMAAKKRGERLIEEIAHDLVATAELQAEVARLREYRAAEKAMAQLNVRELAGETVPESVWLAAHERLALATQAVDDAKPNETGDKPAAGLGGEAG